MNGFVVSDADDMNLFRSLEEEQVDHILRIKHDDPHVEVDALDDIGVKELSAKAWARLGQIIGNAAHPPDGYCVFESQFDDIQQSGFCRGLQTNEHINHFIFRSFDLRLSRMGCLDSLLTCNPSLKYIWLRDCTLDSTAIDLLSTALLGRLSDTLTYLRLQGSRLGDVDLGKLVEALMRNVHLEWLNLDKTGIGSKACESLAKLLSNHPTLNSLELSDNAIGDDEVSLLVDSLTENTNSNLEELCLDGNEGITSMGWSMLLKLLCNSSTIENVLKSNHTLRSLGWFLGKAVERVMGTKDYNILRALLEVNSKFEGNEMAAARLKILLCHTWSDLNIGVSSVPTGALPRILAWFVLDDSDDEADDNDDEDDEADTSSLLTKTIIEYHWPPLKIWRKEEFRKATIPTAKSKLGVIRLDSVYRIVRHRPDLFSWRGASE
ncbi:hypothetical protein ACHAXT_012823 [Thalassiosira profunda]